MRTNIVLNDELVSKAMEISNLQTKKDVVEMALQEYVQNNSRKNILELKGQIRFSDGYDHKMLREGKRIGPG